VHHAFPDVRIVTAAIDPDLQEMHVPLSTALMGEAAGEADFAVRVVSERSSSIPPASGTRTGMRGEMASLESEHAAPNVDVTVTEAEAEEENDGNAATQLSTLSLEAQKGEAEADQTKVQGVLGALAGEPHAPKLSAQSNMDRLRWDRKRHEAPGAGAGEVLEKRAWVIVPGMGHIGYVAPLLLLLCGRGGTIAGFSFVGAR
jgi:uridine kinase